MTTFLVVLFAVFCVSFAYNPNIGTHPGRLPVIRRPVITDDLINDVNSLQTTWKAGKNVGSSVYGASLSQIKGMLGALKGGPKLPVKKVFEVSPDALPTEFDSRVNWPYCVSIKQIRDQSACGSCFAFGFAEAASDRICIVNKKNVSLSAADPAFCCDECGFGCGGGFPSSVWQYWQKTGVVEEGCWPYPFASCDHHEPNSKNPCPGSEYESPPCANECKGDNWNGPSWTNDRHVASSVYTIDDGETAIMQEIFKNGPVETAFTVYEDFLTYSSGVYKHVRGSELGGHAVKIIGWGVENGQKYWLTANSWNPSWGDQGFFKILRGTNECGFEDEVNGGVPKPFN